MTTIERLKELLKDATKGPWYYDYGNQTWREYYGRCSDLFEMPINCESRESKVDPQDDIDLMTNALWSLPDLIAKIEAYEEALKRISFQSCGCGIIASDVLEKWRKIRGDA